MAMRRGYDPSNSSSETYSVLDSQPVTRASSTTAATTPSDEGFSRDRYGSKLGSTQTSKFGDSLHVDTGTDYMEQYTEPHGPYFSLPLGPTSDAPSLVRRPTTKELIGRYESISTSSRSPGKTSSLEFPQRSPAVRSGPEEKRGKGRSPIRQSFRSLLSVFSKKGKMGKTNSNATLVAESTSGIAVELKKRNPLHIRTSSDLPLVKESLQEPPCTTPLPIMSGTLLHLCYPNTQDAFPVWTRCDVVLHPSHILITWLTNRGNPSTSMVTFENCTDVRSLALADLDLTERGLLPSEPDDPRPFELLFEGRAREKFAAESVKERAGWVSAIWDSVLKSNQEKTYTPSLQNPHSLPPASREPSPQLSSPHHAPPRLSPVATSPPNTHRDLPALPEPTPATNSTARFELYDAPVPQAAPPPSTPAKSMFLEPPPARSQSPSIRNLDQRSVVRQRLAEIERTSSMRTGSPSSEKSTRSRQIMGATYSPASTRPSLSVRTADLSRKNNVSSAGESIIDAYSNNESPLSMYSGRLTSIPSSSPRDQESPTPRSAMNVLSPNDRYSPLSTFSLKPPSLRPPSLKAPSPPADRPGAGQTRSMFIHPPSSTETVIPRASQLRMSIEQEARISGLQAQFATVQKGLDVLPQEVGAIISERSQPPPLSIPPSAPEPMAAPKPQPAPKSPSTNNGGAGAEGVIHAIDESVRRIEEQGELNARGLSGVHAKVEALMGLHSQMAAAGTQGSLGPVDISEITTRLAEMREGLQNDLPMIAQKLEELVNKVSAGSGEVNMSNLSPSGQTSDNAGEPSTIQAKLDDLLAICRASQEQAPSQTTQEDGGTVQEVLELLKSEQGQRTQQMEQQADNARYLNELNTWLETFVAHGTSQIETVVDGVQQLCKELGPVQEIGPDGQPVPQEGGSLLSDVKKLLLEHRERGDDSAMLQESVNGMMTAIQEDLRRNAEAQSTLTNDSIVTLIERQRQDQENMLRTLASELSNEIRGERLRFVEAMKEATTINVQIHVEEFKKELTREVLSMTQDVARLHRERQTLEQRIADLFAFYAKQKQDKAKQAPQPQPQPRQKQQRQPRQQQQQQPQQPLSFPQDLYPQVMERGPSSHERRPLPNPIPRGMPGA